MHEHDSGEGRLQSLEADSRVFVVDYVLDVDSEVKGESATLSPVTVEFRYALRVKPRNNETIPDGEYTLKTLKEILRVRKIGLGWKVILS
jgi:hypothetical protein